MEKSDDWGWPPTVSPPSMQRDDHWRHFDNSVNAVSFGFVATAVLISMFLVMAIFERFLRPTSPATPPDGRRFHRDVESQMEFNEKLRIPSPKSSANASEISSVLMPGEDIPTFIAHPAPVPCPPERVSWPTHQHKSLPSVTQDSDSSPSPSSI